MQRFFDLRTNRGKSREAGSRSAGKKIRTLDSYQESLNKLGREQFLKIVNRGFSLPVKGHLSY
jgi:hypothetical protein